MYVIDTIKELYEQNPESKKSFVEVENGKSLQTHLNSIKSLSLKDFSIESLEKHQDKTLPILFSHLPGNVIYQEFGYEALFWTWLSITSPLEQHQFIETIQTVSGKKRSHLEKIKLSTHHFNGSEDIKTCYALDRLMEYINNEFYKTFDIGTKVLNYPKKGVTLSEKRNKQYSLVPLNTLNNESEGYEEHWSLYRNKKEHFFDVYLDSPIGVGLTYKGDINAVMGLMVKDSKTLMIYQLQKVIPEIDKFKFQNSYKRISPRGLFPLNWRKLMVNECAGNIGRELGFERIGIVSGELNYWNQSNEKDHHLNFKDAFEKYDLVAKKLGFEQKEDKNWYKSL